MTSQVNTSAFDANFQAQPGFAGIVSACANSPTLSAMLSNMPANSIHLGAAGGGTSSNPGSNPTITVDPNWLPQSGNSLAESIQVFATTLAHDWGTMLF